MFRIRRVEGLVVLVVMATLAVDHARAQWAAQPLTEDKIVRMVELKIKAEVVASMIQKQGLGFAVDDAAVDRLKKAGAPDAVLDAVRQAGAAKPASAPDKPVMYQDVAEFLQLGVPEQVEPALVEATKSKNATVRSWAASRLASGQDDKKR